MDTLHPTWREHADSFADMIMVSRKDYTALLAEVEALREQLNGAYRERNQVVAWAAAMAIALGQRVIVTKTAIDGWDVAWHNCIFIETPAGQASWHFHDDDAPLFAAFPHAESYQWDGHTTPEKYARLQRMSDGTVAQESKDV